MVMGRQFLAFPVLGTKTVRSNVHSGGWYHDARIRLIRIVRALSLHRATLGATTPSHPEVEALQPDLACQTFSGVMSLNWWEGKPPFGRYESGSAGDWDSNTLPCTSMAGPS